MASISINRVHAGFLRQLLDMLTSGGSVLEGCTLGATILDATTSVDDEWDSKGITTGLGDFTTLGEHGGTTRVALSSVATLISVTQAFLDFANPTFSAVTATANAPEHVLIYAKESGAGAFPANHWPVALVDCSFTPDGTNVTPNVPVNGLFSLEANP